MNSKSIKNQSLWSLVESHWEEKRRKSPCPLFQRGKKKIPFPPFPKGEMGEIMIRFA